MIQYRATCSVTALVQRMGRGGRNLSSEAVGIFFVESKLFDEERQLAIVKKERKAMKRKIGHVSFIKEEAVNVKRARGGVGSSTQMAGSSAMAQALDTDVNMHDGWTEARSGAGQNDESEMATGTTAIQPAEVEESDAARCIRYEEQPKKTTEPQRAKKREQELEVVMDDLINAGFRGLQCRRRPLNIFFHNDQTSTSFLIRRSHCSLPPMLTTRLCS